MIKVADKPSMDPVQQKLRMLKKQWNKDVSAFIDNLIHYKKLTNGQPNKFYKERSAIKDPIPADPATIVGSLAGDFQELSQRANAIIAAQVDYSKTRRKKQPKPTAPGVAPVEVPNTPPANDLSKQLAAFEQKYELVSEASNPITRFFTKLLNPTFGLSEAARIRRYRMNLLDAAVKAYKDLGKLQVAIVSSSPDSITSANKLLHQVWNDWMLVYRGFTTYKSNMPAVVQDTGGEIAPPKDLEDKKKETPVVPAEEVPQPAPDAEKEVASLMERSKQIMSDYSKNHLRLDSSQLGNLEIFIAKFMKSPGQYRPLYALKLIEEYNRSIASLNQSLQTSGNTLGDIAKQVEDKKKAASYANEQLEVVSQDFLKKWLGKARYQLSSSKTSSYRLDMYKMAAEVRKTLDQIMNSLEKGMNIEELDPLVLQVNRQITAMRGLMRALHGTNPAPPKGPAATPTEDLWTQRMDML
jgi:hypothetical protein